MTVIPNLALVLVVGVLVGTGVYLLLERSLSRVIIGVALIGNGVNVLFLIVGGAAGAPPIGDGPGQSDPLPQAMVLTAIVITLGMTAFVLAMAYRSWQLHGHDEVQDDLEDRRLAARLLSGEDLDTRTDDSDLATEAAEARDETDEVPHDQRPEAGGLPTAAESDHPADDDVSGRAPSGEGRDA